MAQGNMLLGYARGSVGDVTFTRTNGNQVTRARNRRPKNPKTYGQMFQRSLFADAVKMYQLAISKFFKFAFEDRKPHESDYNAFMRHNVKNGTNITKPCFDDMDYPAIGKWVFSSGSLQPLNVRNEANSVVVDMKSGVTLPTGATDPQTVGALSSLLIDNERYFPGDMITIVTYGWGPYGGTSYPFLVPPTDEHETWFTYEQFILDPEDTMQLSQFGYDARVANGILMMESTGEPFDERYVGICFIHSRNTGGNIQCSTSQLTLSGAYQQAYEDSLADTYIEQVVASWNATGTAILDPNKNGTASNGAKYLFSVQEGIPTTVVTGGELSIAIGGLELRHGDAIILRVNDTVNQGIYANGAVIGGWKLGSNVASPSQGVTFLWQGTEPITVSRVGLTINGKNLSQYTPR